MSDRSKPPDPHRLAGEGDSRHGFSRPRGQDLVPGSRGGRFGRMFAFLPERDPGDAAIAALYGLLEAEATRGDDGTIPAGYTYLGQFIDHDITFDPTSQLQRSNDPAALVDFRTPRFDLDSLYGAGPEDQPFLYEWTNTEDRLIKLLVGENPGDGVHAREDLPRNQQGRALIGDRRNDEHLVIAQLHLLFIRFHNKVVDRLRGRFEGRALFEEAQRIVRWHYQWIVIHDFLERLVGVDLAREVLVPGAAAAPPTARRRFFTWRDEPYVPVEFSGAAFRLGHSMVRFDYAYHHRVTKAIVGEDPDSDAHLGGFRRLPETLRIEWRRFFFDPDEPVVTIAGLPMRQNTAMLLDHHIVPALFSLPHGGQALPWLNLQRGRALGLPAGVDVARAMGVAALSAEQLLLTGPELDADDHTRQALYEATPLWYYVLREAAVRENGRRLGPVGGRIVAETLVGLLEADPHSYLRQWPGWRPADDNLPAKTPDDFTMLDLIAFAGDGYTGPDVA